MKKINKGFGLGFVVDMAKRNPLIVVIGLAALWFLTPVGSFIRNKLAAMKASASTTEYQSSKVETVALPKETYNLQQVADQVYSAFHQSGLFNISEDEERAIDAIKSVPQPYVKEVARLYAKTGKDMYKDFIKYLSKNDYTRVEAWLR
jgi:hypothetical protein